MFSFKKKKKLVGLDIGTSAIKLLAGSSSGGKFSVEQMSIVPLPYKAVDEQGIHDVNAVQTALSTALDQAGLRDKSMAASVRGPGVLTKRILLPKIPKKEIPEQVRWEAEQVFPQDMSSILVDHILLGEIAQLPNAPKGTKGWDILLVGVHQDEVLNIKNVVESLSAHIDCVDLDIFAVGDLLEQSLGVNKKKYTAFVDVGASSTRVGVRHQGNTVFLREFSIAGNAFTEVIAQNLGLSFEDAEALKIQGEQGAFPQEAIDALNMTFSQWRAELQQCEDIFISQESEGLISQWYFFGGAVKTPGLLDILADDRFRGKVKLVEADKYLKASGKQVDKSLLQVWSSRLLTAAGLSSREAGA